MKFPLKLVENLFKEHIRKLVDGSISIGHGGEYDGDRKIEDLKLLYRAYVVNALSSGRMEINKIAELNQLGNIIGLVKREAEAITLDVTSRVYPKKLVQAVSNGYLERADSKATFLQNLCEELH
ncbi:hypothetical protein JHK82_031542 [Glycine max]|nr:hypothetical protein JHK86_031629 [Glycine max]KAG5124805.1 hypothetical protein JHK82_031542 [Glycine max]